MSISYEEALSTLQAMFGAPWTRELLDSVLRHQQGHMENTVDLILRHSDKDPELLVQQLKAGVDPNQSAITMDEQIARQLQEESTRRPTAPPSNQPPSSRGAPVDLPPDFLRIPGRPTTTATSQLQDDEALARMLQDELFSNELSRNPDFAHLARGRRAATARSSAAPASRTGSANSGPEVNIMEKISELGDNARRRLQMMAAQFQASRQPQQAVSSPAAAERRGLLDDDGDDMELAARKDL